MKLMVIEVKTITIRINKIKPCMRDIIIDLQESDTWKVQLTISFYFISLKDLEEERVMHLESSNIHFGSYNDENGFSSTDVLQICHKVTFRRGGSDIDYPLWIKKKKATINPKN